MSLRTRALLLIVGAVAVAVVTFGWIAQTVVVDGFSDLERADAQERLQRVVSALEADLEAQLALTRSYAEDPAVARLATSAAPRPAAVLAGPDDLRTTQVDAVLVLDGLGRPVREVTTGRPLPLDLERRLRDNTLRVSSTGEPHVRGLVSAESGVAAFVTHLIASLEGGPPVGAVVTVRRFDDTYRARLAERSFVDAVLAPVRDRGLRMAPAPFDLEGIRTVSEGDLVHARGFLPDPAGWYAVEVTTEVPRAIAAAGRSAADRLLVMIVVTSVLVGTGVFVWFERRLLSRLARLTDLVARSESEHRPTVELTGDDELAQLARRIEDTLTTLELAQDTLRRTNAELAVASRMKDDFVSMVSHEFRTPLTAIRGYADTLQRYAARIDDDKRDAFTARIGAQTAVLERMVDDLLTLAQSREGTLRACPEPVRVADALAEALEVVPHAAGVTVDVPADVVAVADPDHTRRILVNYVENARKYGAEPIVITATEAGGSVEVRVRDHGPGVDASFTPALFDRFSQASVGTQRTAKGVGLGLSIVRRLAEANGGDVWYEPATPGAVFGVRLPRAGDGMPTPDRGADQRDAPVPA